MPNSLTKFKDKLATLPEKSLRYKFGTSLWDEDRIQDAHACTFYWFYLPSTVVGWFFVGVIGLIFLAATYLVYLPFRFLLVGQTPDDLSLDYIYDGERWSKVGYSVVSKKKRWIAPQSAIAYGILLVIAVGILSHADIDWGRFFFWVGIILAGVATITLIGWLLTRKKSKEVWNRICPDLRVINND